MASIYWQKTTWRRLPGRRYLCSHWSVSRYIKIVRQTSEPWSIFGRESVSACRNPKCLNVDRPTDDRQKKNCLSMVGRWSTVGRRTLQRLLQLKKSTTVAEKNYYLARRTQNRSADEKKRSNSAKTMADELPTVAQRIPFLLKTRLPLVVFF